MATLDDRVPVWRTMLIFIVPLLLSSVLQAASGTISNIYLARLIDMRAFAVSATLLPILYVLFSTIAGLSSASSILIGRAYGAGDERGVQRAAGTALGFILCTGIAVGGLACGLAPLILAAIGTPSDIFPQAIAFARVTFALVPATFIFLGYSAFLRGLGDSRTPFRLLVLSEVIFLGGTPLLILGALGLPKLGILGLPVANAASVIVGSVVLWCVLAWRGSPVALGSLIRYLRPDRGIVRELLHIGSAAAAQMMVVSLAEVAVLAFVNRFGWEATAAFGAINQLLTYIQFPASCLGAAAAVFGAQSIGSVRLDRLPQIARAGFLLNYALGGGAIVLCYLFAGPLISLFVTQPEIVRIARELLYIALWSYVIYGNTSVLTGLMRANGTVLWPTAINIAAIWLVQVPIAWALSNGPLALRGIWVAYPVGFGCALVAMVTVYRRLWLRRLPAAAPPPGDSEIPQLA